MIDLAAAKAHLRVETSADDTLIAGNLAAAIAMIENATSKPLTAAEFKQTVDGFPCGDKAIRLWKGPVHGDTAALAIAYDDADGVEQTLADFRLIEGSSARLLPAFGDHWPATANGPGTVRITYTAGFASGEVPAVIDQAVLMLVGHFYLNREAVASGSGVAAVEFPLGVAELLAPYVTPGIA